MHKNALFAAMKGGAGKNIKLFVMVRGTLKLALKTFGVSVCCANPTLNTFYTIKFKELQNYIGGRNLRG